MKLPRREFLRLAAGAAALPAAARAAWAQQTYPTRPVHLICGFAAGGPNDIVSRLIAQWLSERLGQQFVVDNRTGAAGNIGTEAVVRAPADGYTLLLVSSANAVNATLYSNLSYNFIRDIAPVAGLVRVPNAMVVNPSVPANTIPEFIAYARANPGKINMATSGNGSTTHISGELFKEMTGVDLVPVAYRGGGPALIDLLAGQMQVMFEPTVSTIAYIRAGKLRALAVTTATRSELLPEVPSVNEFVPGYEASQWYGIGAPKSTPPEIVAKLNQEINAALADPRMKMRFSDLGGVPTPMTPAEFAKLIADETEKWGKVIRAGNIKAD
ncbi:MAG TPA: tripartite tricarboxylate transporter substrate binding protein [Xanthobacteraceae bacterium]